MNELALFAGAGGGILAGKLLGWTTVGAVEIEDYPRRVLLQRQRDGILPKFPIWDDVRTFDGKPWRGLVDVVSGGFPCQDISVAGKGAGIDGERSGLWSEMARVIREVRPRFAFVENSAALTSRGLHRVLGDLAEMGFNAEWGVLGGQHVGLPVKRERIWILARTNLPRLGVRGSSKATVKFSEKWCSKQRRCRTGNGETLEAMREQTVREILLERWQETKPELLRASNGVAAWVDRFKAIGNGQVPAVAALAWNVLSERLDTRQQ